jgi:hypothetical protein
MDGPPRGAAVTPRQLIRHVEVSRVQLELVRRAFELIVPVSTQRSHTTVARHTPQSADRARRVRRWGA